MSYDCSPCSRQTFPNTGMSSNMPAGQQMMPAGQQMMPAQQMPSGPQWFSTPQGGFPQPTYPAAPIGTTLPTGVPLGPSMLPFPVQVMPPQGEAVPNTLDNYQFTPGFLRTQIGKRVRVEFLMGTGTLVDRSGTLVGVGASYILIRPIESDDIMMCDIYSIKFATIFY